MATNTYIVTDCFADTNLDTCKVFLKNQSGTSYNVNIPLALEYIVGARRFHMSTLTSLQTKILEKYNQVRIENLGKGRTYYKGYAYFIKIICSTYVTYSAIGEMIRYQFKGTNIFLCNTFESLEDMSLKRLGIYAAQYVHHNKTLVKAQKQDYFKYTPRVAGFDLEMLSLHGLDPESEVYMCGYYCDNKNTLIYTSKYCNVAIPNTLDTTYVMVNSVCELVKKLAQLIYRDRPDILTGYNIYNADMPLLYHELRKELDNWPKDNTNLTPYFVPTKKMDKQYIDSSTGYCIRIPGVQVIDMYRYIDKITPNEERGSLSLGAVSEKHLGEGKDDVGYDYLYKTYYNGTLEDKIVVMKYCSRDSMLPVKLYYKFNVWNYHRNMYELTGVDAQRLMITGSITPIYGMCAMRATEIGVYMDEPRHKIFRPTGGHVFEPEPGFYQDVACIDVTSLYPNIVIQFSIDPLNLLDDADIADPDIKYNTLHTSGGKPKYFLQDNEDSVLPYSLNKLLETRAKLKKQMAHIAATTKDEHELMLLSGAEQATKELANSACGAYGEQTEGNPLSFCMINDIITTKGREIITTAANIATSSGLKVIYGDTDSLFIYPSFLCEKLILDIHKQIPEKIRFKIEYKAKKFIMGKKKHYIYHAEGSDRPKTVGYKATKSSRCKAAHELFKSTMTYLLDNDVEGAMNHYKQKVCYYLDPSNIDIEMFFTKFRYTGKVYHPTSYQGLIVNNFISRGVELVPGQMVGTVTVYDTETYISKYGYAPPISLPNKGSNKNAYTYTTEEVKDYLDVIDTTEMLNVQCLSDITTILDHINSGKY